METPRRRRKDRQPPSRAADRAAAVRSAEPDPPYPADFTSAAPSDYDIACRAYELYQERGAGPGHDLEDWLRAERELRSSRPS